MSTVLQAAKDPISGNLLKSAHERVKSPPSASPTAPASRFSRRVTPNDISTSSTSPEPSSKAFQRFRSSVEQSLRTAARSKKSPSLPKVEIAITTRNSRVKEGTSDVHEIPKEKKTMLRRLESKVTFRKAREPAVSQPVNDDHDKVRAAGFTSFITPSIRQASMSSPTLHLSSPAFPSPSSRPAIPVSSSSVVDILVSPKRERSRRTTSQPQQPDFNTKVDGNAVSGLSKEPSHRKKNLKRSLPPLPSTPTLERVGTHESVTPPQYRKELPSPPGTPTPPTSRSQLVRVSSKSPPLETRVSTPRLSGSPIPVRARSPTTRVRAPISSPRGLTSSSTSHIPISPRLSPALAPARRQSIDSPRRPRGNTPSPSTPDLPQRSPPESPFDSSRDSPSPVRRRPMSPGQQSYSQNRYCNISSASLALPTPEHRELIRSAASMLCKEMLKPSTHIIKMEADSKDWEEVEIRMRALSRSERVWAKSGGPGSPTNGTSSGLSNSGEERERRLFGEALRDGYVLCQLLNKLRSRIVVRPDSREDGLLRSSNIAKFLAACASYGLPNEDLFHQEDLMEATRDSLARVARTIIALVEFVDSSAPSKFFFEQTKVSPGPPAVVPYGQSSSSRASASTPNLHPVSTSPIPPSPSRKRWSPPSQLPTLQSNSSNESPPGPRQPQIADNEEDAGQVTEVRKDLPLVQVIMPPPRSPLRARSIKRQDDGGLYAWAKKAASPTRSSATTSTFTSIGDASGRDFIVDHHNARQSVASTAMTDTTINTQVSSILDNGTSSGGNKFGTVRTVTTDLTSEAPSLTRAEGNVIANDIAGRKILDINSRMHSRERRTSGAPPVDLSRVAEEEETISSKAYIREKGRPESPERTKINLRQGGWPHDFFDVFQAPPISPKPSPSPPLVNQDVVPISISPPRKLSIIVPPRRNEILDAPSQLARRPSHRTRHTVDAPILMPKDSLIRRDTSPIDGVSGASSRIALRRHSTQRHGTYQLKSNIEEPRDSDSDSPVPFPKSEQLTGRSPSRSSPSKEGAPLTERPRLLRGRFQSDVDSSSSRRQAGPNSADAFKPTRSRFESMVNLGVASGNASASDLLSRESMDGNAMRMTIVVREDGKPPTHFQLGNCIGRGQFGSVYRALNLNTGQMVAVKRIRLEGLKEEEVTTLMREVDLVKSLSHPSIVKYEGMARDNDTLNIVLEYVENGSLGQTLKAFGKLNERLVASYVIKILEGLHYLHQCDVVHCDLKAANILTTKNGNVKLSDFGVSLNLRAMEREMKDVAGTPNWMAPEVIELKGASTKADIWSLACTVIELLTGKPPYADITNGMSVMFRIVEDAMPPLPEGCSPLLENFLSKCFHKDPSMRPNAEQLFEHAWLKKNWGALNDLRPQDSIPFLRRVSADFQKSDAVRYLTQADVSKPPTPELFTIDDTRNGSPIGRRTSTASASPLGDNDISPRKHTFVKTTFNKPMVCRVCLLNVKKSAVLCSECSLISHAKCAMNAPPTCDLRAQLLLYAQYAEKGNLTSIYSNPADDIHDKPMVSTPDVPYVTHAGRNNVETPPSPISPTSASPPSAFTFIPGFMRSRASASPEPVPSSTSSPLPGDSKPTRRRPSVLHKHSKDRHSTTSNSTGLSSLRSAATATESLESPKDSQGRKRDDAPIKGSSDQAPRQSRRFLPYEESKHYKSSRLAATEIHDRAYPIPGAMPTETRRQTKQESKTNCIVQ